MKYVLFAVLCGQFAQKRRGEAQIQPPYTFSQLLSSGRLETLINPTVDRFCEAQKLVQHNILYFQGEQLENGE
ncbi:ARID/BRIGHT DNA binding domain [Musa troglodytarum]|nr:ARID/BRIGHT DNA binding domain [Musa troglodytarum]